MGATPGRLLHYLCMTEGSGRMADPIWGCQATDEAPGAPDDEAELVERARRQPHAFGQLYDRYYSVILNYVYRRTLDMTLAEELTSNTFFNALRSLGRYQNRGKFAPWLYRIAGNEIRLHWRARRNQHSGHERWLIELERVQYAGDGPLPLEEAEERARRFAAIHEALGGLPERYQAVLALRYFESLSIEEIAEVLDTKTGTVKSLIHRGLARLKTRYERGGATLSSPLHYSGREE